MTVLGGSLATDGWDTSNSSPERPNMKPENLATKHSERAMGKSHVILFIRAEWRSINK
jgi:hypothetical protein